MKKLVILLIVISTPVFGKSYDVNRSFQTCAENVKDVVMKIKENKKNKDIRIKQYGNSDFFEIYWVEVVDLDIDDYVNL